MSRCDVRQSSTHTNETACFPQPQLKEGKADRAGRTKLCVCAHHKPARSCRAGRGVAVSVSGGFGWPQPDLQVEFSQVLRREESTAYSGCKRSQIRSSNRTEPQTLLHFHQVNAQRDVYNTTST